MKSIRIKNHKQLDAYKSKLTTAQRLATCMMHGPTRYHDTDTGRAKINPNAFPKTFRVPDTFPSV